MKFSLSKKIMVKIFWELFFSKFFCGFPMWCHETAGFPRFQVSAPPTSPQKPVSQHAFKGGPTAGGGGGGVGSRVASFPTRRTRYQASTKYLCKYQASTKYFLHVPDTKQVPSTFANTKQVPSTFASRTGFLRLS